MAIYLVFGLTYGFACAVMPGPLLTFLISQALNSGWRRTLPAIFSPMISDVPVAILVLLVLTNVPVLLIPILKIAGGLFTFYLAWGAIKAWRTYELKQTATVQSVRQNVLKATMVNILNPGPYLGWGLVLGPQLLKGWRETPVNGITLVIGFYGIMLVTLAAIIFLFSAARSLGPKVNRAMLGFSAFALGGFGIYQLWTGIMAL